jgi:hypothetical protein
MHEDARFQTGARVEARLIRISSIRRPRLEQKPGAPALRRHAT